MAQEEKELLLKDLSARLLYNVHCRVFKLNGDIKENDDILYGVIGDNVVTLKSDKDECLMYYQIKPYLRPLSSMAEEEKHKLLKFGAVTCLENGEVVDVSCVGFERHADIQDYLNACHLDYRGLIPMGLALEAPKDMYNN